MLVAGNWKMFKGPAETVAFLEAFEPPAGVEAVVCPPFTSLAAAVGRGVPVYAQNVHWAAEGAFTGEISAQMLLELGVEGTIVGHSERRQYFGETDDTVRARCEAALGAGLRVIACVGETGAAARGGGDRRGAAAPARRDPPGRRARDRVRACLGDRDRKDRDARDGAGGPRDDQGPARHTRALRRLGEARERGRADGTACDRRRARRRRLARGGVVRGDLPRRRCDEPRGAAARHAGDPRRLGDRAARPGQCRRPRANARLRRPRGPVSDHGAPRVRAGGRPARGPDGELGGRAPHDRLGPHPLPGPRARQPCRRGPFPLRRTRRCSARSGARRSATARSTCSASSRRAAFTRTSRHLRALLDLARRRGDGGADVDPRLHRRTRRLAARRGRRPGDAAAGPDRDGRRALLRDGPRQALGPDRPRARRDASAASARRPRIRWPRCARATSAA